MLQDVSQKFAGGCMMLVRKKESAVVFLGTAFLMHEDGYLLTAAHLLEEDSEGLMVVPTSNPDDFMPISLDKVSAMSVSVPAVDKIHNVAVLEIDRNLRIKTPDHLGGTTENFSMGTSVLSLGFPFGHDEMHNLVVQSAILSSKVCSRNGNRLLLFDAMVYDGVAGGPLVSGDSGRVVGVVIGRFSPVEDGGDFARGSRPSGYDTQLSYAVSIEYGLALMENMGLDVV
ncbi:serine protease [Desulfoluna sp.]|uniref:S1 family peptidase n=1 Tax=Desulfoluna sp. TaxID=2045199 RepID=UPI0026038DFA|nr:serine protease [Desulfoluna sp.]